MPFRLSQDSAQFTWLWQLADALFDAPLERPYMHAEAATLHTPSSERSYGSSGRLPIGGYCQERDILLFISRKVRHGRRPFRKKQEGNSEPNRFAFYYSN